MVVVLTTTGTAAVEMLIGQINTFTTAWPHDPSDQRTTDLLNSGVEAVLIVAMLVCTAVVVLAAAKKITGKMSGEPAATPGFGRVAVAE